MQDCHTRIAGSNTESIMCPCSLTFWHAAIISSEVQRRKQSLRKLLKDDMATSKDEFEKVVAAWIGGTRWPWGQVGMITR